MATPHCSSAYTKKQKAKKAEIRERKRQRANNRSEKRIGRGDRVVPNWERIKKDIDLWQGQIIPEIMTQLLANRETIIKEKPEGMQGTTLGRAGEKNCWKVAMELPDGRKMDAIFCETELKKQTD